MIIIGIDPGLRHTGYGIIRAKDNNLSHIANGTISPKSDWPLADRLAHLFDGLVEKFQEFSPELCAIEDIFVSKNALSTLKLGHARGVALLAPAHMGCPVREFANTTVKKSITGVGRADKGQMIAMINILLPASNPTTDHAADALAVAICAAHYNLIPHQAHANAHSPTNT